MVPVENLVPRTSLHTVEHAFLVPGQNAGIELEDPVGYIAVPVGIGIIGAGFALCDAQVAAVDLGRFGVAFISRVIEPFAVGIDENVAVGGQIAVVIPAALEAGNIDVVVVVNIIAAGITGILVVDILAVASPRPRWKRAGGDKVAVGAM